MKRGKNGANLSRRLVRPGSGRAEKDCSIIDDPNEPVVPVVQGQVATHGDYAREGKESGGGYRGIFGADSTVEGNTI
jgi:hypothetical protein